MGNTRPGMMNRKASRQVVEKSYDVNLLRALEIHSHKLTWARGRGGGMGSRLSIYLAEAIRTEKWKHFQRVRESGFGMAETGGMHDPPQSSAVTNQLAYA